MEYHYTYRITNKKTNKHYYGVRTSRNKLPNQDLGKEYFSSSTNKDFKKDQKENPQDYKYKVVYICNSREQALRLESKLHNMFDVGINESFYNKVKSCDICKFN